MSIFLLLMRLLDKLFKMLMALFKSLGRSYNAVVGSLAHTDALRQIQRVGLTTEADMPLMMNLLRGPGAYVALGLAVVFVASIVVYQFVVPYLESRMPKMPESFKHTSIAPNYGKSPTIDRDFGKGPSIRWDYDRGRRELENRRAKRSEAVTDLQRNFPDDQSMNSVHDYTNQVIQPYNPPVQPSPPSTQQKPFDLSWEVKLMEERLKSGANYDKLLQQHHEIYRSRGLNPSNSGFIPDYSKED